MNKFRILEIITTMIKFQISKQSFAKRRTRSKAPQEFFKTYNRGRNIIGSPFWMRKIGDIESSVEIRAHKQNALVSDRSIILLWCFSPSGKNFRYFILEIALHSTAGNRFSSIHLNSLVNYTNPSLDSWYSNAWLKVWTSAYCFSLTVIVDVNNEIDW